MRMYVHPPPRHRQDSEGGRHTPHPVPRSSCWLTTMPPGRPLSKPNRVTEKPIPSLPRATEPARHSCSCLCRYFLRLSSGESEVVGRVVSQGVGDCRSRDGFNQSHTAARGCVRCVRGGEGGEIRFRRTWLLNYGPERGGCKTMSKSFQLPGNCGGWLE